MAPSNTLSGRPVMRALPALRRPVNPKIAEARSTDLLQALFESRPVADVEFCGASHRGHLRRFKRTDHPRRRADDQGMLGKLFAFCDHRTRADDAAAANSRAVHYDRSH